MTGLLSVVCTPIGNLDDLSPRAAAALRRADAVLAEDTRHSAPLLAAAASNAPLFSCHQHNEEERAVWACEQLRQGKNLAVISDAGAPSISDPGGRLVAAVVDAGLPIEVVPGPSAVIAALMGAGLIATRFTFVGFLPQKQKSRLEILSHVAAGGFAAVLFEAPQRTLDTLVDLHKVFGNRRVVVARELTKKFETFHRGVLDADSSHILQPPFVDKGEIVIVVEAGPEKSLLDEHETEDAVQKILDDNSKKPKEKAKLLASLWRISPNEAYQRLLTHTQERASGESQDKTDAGG